MGKRKTSDRPDNWRESGYERFKARLMKDFDADDYKTLYELRVLMHQKKTYRYTTGKYDSETGEFDKDKVTPLFPTLDQAKSADLLLRGWNPKNVLNRMKAKKKFKR